VDRVLELYVRVAVWPLWWASATGAALLLAPQLPALLTGGRR
jgi:hypothetical protein